MNQPSTSQLRRTEMSVPTTDDIIVVVTTARTTFGYESRAVLLEADMVGEDAVLAVYETDGAVSEADAKRLHNRLCAAWWPCTCPWCDGKGGGNEWDCALCDGSGWMTSSELAERLDDERPACA